MTEKVRYIFQRKLKERPHEGWGDFSINCAPSIEGAQAGLSYFKEAYPELEWRVVKITTEIVLQ